MSDTRFKSGALEVDAFPTKQIVVLAICRLAEPIAFTSVMSYTYVMVQEMCGGTNVSLLAGIVVSAFALAESCTAIFWGALSDRYGRKPIILMGLIGTTLSCLVLGFAKQYWVAVFARLLGGLLNGNVAVIQTMVSETIKNPKHEPIAYSMHPLMWSIGSILGSALGGYTAQPAHFNPDRFSPDGIFGQYPYLLPNLVCIVIISIAIVQAAILLEETRVIRSEESDRSTHLSEQDIDEQTPLQAETRQAHHGVRWKSQSTILSVGTGSLPSPTDPSFDVRRSSFGTIRPLHLKITSFPEIAVDEVNSPSSSTSVLSNKTFTKEVNAWILAIVLMCYHVLAFMSVLPIYVVDKPQNRHGLDLRGGLGLTIHEVANYLAINSIWSLIVQIAIFPWLMAKAGVWNCVLWSTLMCPLIDFLVPFISLLPNPALALYVAYCMRTFLYIMVYPGQLILLKNAAPSTKVLGKINGMTVSAASIGRTIAPPAVGIVYDRLGSGAAWWSCGAFAIVSVAQLFFLRRPKNEEQAAVYRASVDNARTD